MLQKLPVDIVYILLQYSTGFEALYGLILTTKHVHDVFKTHSRSILSAVARAEAGPVYKQAARLAIVQKRGVEWDIYADPPQMSSDIPSEDEARVTAVDRALVNILSDNARTVRRLETFYSRRYKDPTSTASTLTDTELLKFTRGLYRFMIYWAIFRPPWRTMRRDYEMSEDEGDDEVVLESAEPSIRESLRTQQRVFLKGIAMTDAEKLEFAAARDFLEEALFWATNKFSGRSKYVVDVSRADIWHGIAKVIPNRERHNIIPFYDRRLIMGADYAADHEMFFHSSEALGHSPSVINEFTLLDGPLHRRTEAAAILDEPRFYHTCASCSREHTSAIYRNTNWDMIYGERRMTLGKLFKHTPPGLSPLQLHLMVTDPPAVDPERFYLLGLLLAVLKSAAARGEVYAPQDWLCLMCIIRLVSENKDAWEPAMHSEPPLER